MSEATPRFRPPFCKASRSTTIGDRFAPFFAREMQLELLPREPDHDPGGKIRLRLPQDVQGDAVFSPCRRYRPLLRRWRGERFPDAFALFIGMNPSTAEAHVDDPTIAREWEFTVREGYDGFAKTNVADYRATKPSMLLEEGVTPSSHANLPTIIDTARRANLVVLCHGCLNKALAPLGAQVIEALRHAGVEIMCFGTNADGSPKHPLYLAKTTPLIPYGSTT